MIMLMHASYDEWFVEFMGYVEHLETLTHMKMSCSVELKMPPNVTPNAKAYVLC